jgi:hypothetical protein
LLRELRDPGKSVPWTSWADRFWLVAPRGVVRDIGELPNDWGLLEAGSTRLTAVRPAKLLRPLEVRDDTVTRERLARSSPRCTATWNGHVDDGDGPGSVRARRCRVHPP